MPTAVVHLGKPALVQGRQRGTADEQRAALEAVCGGLVDLIKAGWRLLITHGGGAQLEHLLQQQEEAAELVPVPPLEVSIAQAQGGIGVLVHHALGNALRTAGLGQVPVAVLVTPVRVQPPPRDPAARPGVAPTGAVGAGAAQRDTWPESVHLPRQYGIGPWFTQARAEQVQKSRGYALRDDGRGWRRIVPLLQPQGLADPQPAAALLQAGCAVVLAGAGGVPVWERPDGTWSAADGIISSDWAAASIARQMQADALLLLTDVDGVFVDFGRPSQRPLPQVDPAEARRLLGEGHFPPHSMAAKLEAAVWFVEQGGKRAAIGALAHAAGVAAGRSGTQVTA